MALVRSFEMKTLERGSLHPTRGDCEWAVFEQDGKRLLQLDTYGSDQRKDKKNGGEFQEVTPVPKKPRKSLQGRVLNGLVMPREEGYFACSAGESHLTRCDRRLGLFAQVQIRYRGRVVKAA
jgi:hypothetical protein